MNGRAKIRLKNFGEVELEYSDVSIDDLRGCAELYKQQYSWLKGEIKTLTDGEAEEIGKKILNVVKNLGIHFHKVDSELRESEAEKAEKDFSANVHAAKFSRDAAYREGEKLANKPERESRKPNTFGK